MKRFILVFLILILGVFLRIYNLPGSPPGLYPDEAMNGNNAAEALATENFQIFYPENNGREGLFMNIQALSIKIFGVREPWVIRLPGAIFGALTVLGMYFLTRELFFDEKKKYKHEFMALLVMFFTATSLWHIIFSRIAFRAIMAPFFLVWGILLLLRGFRCAGEKIPNYEESYRAIGLTMFGGIVFGLGMHSYIAYRIAPIIILALMLTRFLKTKRGKRIIFTHSLLFIIGALVVFAPLGMYFVQNPQDFLGRTSQISVFSSQTPLIDLTKNVGKTLAMFNFVGDWNWRHNISGRPLLFWPVGFVFLLGVFVSFINMFKLRKKWRAVAASPEFLTWIWFFVMLLPVVISNEGLPHALRAIILIPPVMIFAGLGAFTLLEFLRSRTKRHLYSVALIVFVLLLSYEAYFSYFIRWTRALETPDAFSQRYVEIGRVLSAAPQDIDKYVVVNTGGVSVRGIPMPAQTVMYVTNSFTEKKRLEQNIVYVRDRSEIPDDKKRKIVVALEPE